MEKTVFIVGTRHRYQGCARQAWRATTADLEQFRVFLKQLIRDHVDIRAIAEEMSTEGLDREDLHHPDLPSGESVPFQVAQELRLPHKYCDPDSATRHQLGISDSTDEDNRKRQEYWLNQIEEFNWFPCLFILGSNHTHPFRDLLRIEGLNAVVLAEEWKP